MRGGKVLLLTTTGNKSGKLRTVPVMQFDDQGRRFVIGSFAGAPKDPAWIRNLRKTPRAGVEVRGSRYDANTRMLAGEERERIWKKVVDVAPGFAAYQKKAQGREIPIVELVPV
jgi:deazaflavin-dependent oxidoreductase (nitroreductase family)